MSFAGAVRIYLLARQAPQSRRREPEELPPIVEGRWAGWAHRDETLARATTADIHSLTDTPCRLPDGSIGRVAVVLDGGAWTVVCSVARLERVRS
jgi:hypothetical protein